VRAGGHQPWEDVEGQSGALRSDCIEDADTDHEIESAAVRIKAAKVLAKDLALEAAALELTPGLLDGARREVQGCHAEALGGEEDGVNARAATKIEGAWGSTHRAAEAPEGELHHLLMWIAGGRRSSPVIPLLNLH
jgi:hypothetical protein